MRKSFAEQYVTAAVEAGRMLNLALAEIRRLQNYERVELGSDEKELARQLCDTNRTISDISRGLGLSPHRAKAILRKAYITHQVRSRQALAEVLNK